MQAVALLVISCGEWGIAQKSMIVKQAMSRTLKELQEKGMIQTEEHKSDKRSDHITLTPEGKRFILEANTEAGKLMKIYENLTGKENFAIATDGIKKIISYHESLHDYLEAFRGD